MTAASAPTLRSVQFMATDVGRAVEFLSLIVGGHQQRSDGTVRVGNASLEVKPGQGRSHLAGVVIERDVARAAIDRLNGIDVTTCPPTDDPSGSSTTPGSEVMLDHVAVLVADITKSAQAWQELLGVKAERIGLHPISNGSLDAARLDVGGRMIELLAPVSGMPSPAARRLELQGEGPMALAMPAIDLASTKTRLEDGGVRLLWQEPHWFVHPSNPAGTFIQLTPRVQH